MKLYRVVKRQFANDLSGTGARLYGGRWNSEGKAMVYMASSRSLAVLEALAHISPTNMPDDFCMVTIEAPDSFIEIPADQLPNKWHEYPEQNILKQIGDNFLREGKNLFLKVPSALVQEEHNFLLNPTHAKASLVKIKNIKPFSFDARLLDWA